jgi:hypothetical protein
MSTPHRELHLRNLRTVGALAALFLMPLVLSFWMYYTGGWQPAGRTNHGELIEPARPLPAAQAFQGKWTLAYVGAGSCDAACRQALLVMRQTRLALNNEMTRVNRVLLATSDCCDREFLNREHAGLLLIEAPAPSLLNAFPAADRSRSIFVVDPLGNLVMRFDARQDPKGLLQDLKKLLKLSHIG